MEEIIEQTHYLTRIFSRLFSVRPQSIAIIGDRQIGKSTIYKQISNPDIYQKYLPENLKPLFIAYDIAAGFDDWQFLLNSMCLDLAATLNVKHEETDPYHALTELVRSVPNDSAVYYLFDNFELITQNPLAPLEFFSFLRSLANNYRIAYVTCSRASLQSLCVSQDICESPFFNIFTNIELKGFTENEIEALLIIQKLNEIKPVEIIRLCGTHPGLIAHWLNYISSHTQLSMQDMIKGFIAEYATYLESWLEQFDKDTRSLILLVTKSQTVPPELRFIMEGLKRKGYINLEGKLAIQFIQEYLSMSEPTEKKGFLKRLLKK